MFREIRGQIKLSLDDGRRREEDKRVQRELEKQRAINKEIMEARLAEQKELEAAHIRQQQREEEWPKKKLEMGKDARTGNSDSPGSSATQSVKLQRYTFTPFHGDYKDWVRFWNQFEVEALQCKNIGNQQIQLFIGARKGPTTGGHTWASAHCRRLPRSQENSADHLWQGF